ncbi:hypothetical protein F1559_005177 [Cyanidiococcus yangmingshanensis]|uniref:Uncharacterized protein n=1 Tax=Cyanidiococcus yangmingshanensis TaxID=2690220 RepID=A0A7J7INR8_9RHOD|nr:hypothetical protein F1559_005177 [Cyanidiococcus yangmingshanensis]
MEPIPEHSAEKRRSMVEIRLRMNRGGMLALPSVWKAPLYLKAYWLRKAYETESGNVIRLDSEMILMTDRHRRRPPYTAATKACTALCDVFRHFKKSVTDTQESCVVEHTQMPGNEVAGMCPPVNLDTSAQCSAARTRIEIVSC